MNIPLVDLKAQYQPLKGEILEGMARSLEGMYLFLGENVQNFEREFSQFCNTKHGIGVGDGTAALHIILRALEIGLGDEVITTNMTAFPTITGIMQSGATPVVVDIEESTGLIDCEEIAKKITPNTKAIVPVHLYGQACRMLWIKDIAKKNNLKIVEDCAHSIGAEFVKKKTGSFGHCNAFSFYPTKNLGCYGDGGAITTHSPDIYEKLLCLRNYGRLTVVPDIFRYRRGINSRLDEIQAAILRVKLRHLDDWNKKRRKIAKFYILNLENVDFIENHALGRHCYHLFVIRSKDRNELQEYLIAQGIMALIHYQIPVNEQEAYPAWTEETFESSCKLADSVLSLPIYPELKDSEVEKIVDIINKFPGKIDIWLKS